MLDELKSRLVKLCSTPACVSSLVNVLTEATREASLNPELPIDSEVVRDARRYLEEVVNKCQRVQDNLVKLLTSHPYDLKALRQSLARATECGLSSDCAQLEEASRVVSRGDAVERKLEALKDVVDRCPILSVESLKQSNRVLQECQDFILPAANTFSVRVAAAKKEDGVFMNEVEKRWGLSVSRRVARSIDQWMQAISM